MSTEIIELLLEQAGYVKEVNFWVNHKTKRLIPNGDLFPAPASRSSNPRWVKAEVKPTELLKSYYCKVWSEQLKQEFNKTVLIALNGLWLTEYTVTHWLDESPSPSPLQDVSIIRGGEDYNNVAFDIIVTTGFKLTDEEVKKVKSFTENIRSSPSPSSSVEEAAKDLLSELIGNIEGFEIEPKNYQAVPNLRAYSIRIPENWFESAKKCLAGYAHKEKGEGISPKNFQRIIEETPQHVKDKVTKWMDEQDAKESSDYWRKRCEAAEALIHKHYQNIPDSPTYMAWQSTLEPTPADVRKSEVDKAYNLGWKDCENSCFADQDAISKSKVTALIREVNEVIKFCEDTTAYNPPPTSIADSLRHIVNQFNSNS